MMCNVAAAAKVAKAARACCSAWQHCMALQKVAAATDSAAADAMRQRIRTASAGGAADALRWLQHQLHRDPPRLLVDISTLHSYDAALHARDVAAVVPSHSAASAAAVEPNALARFLTLGDTRVTLKIRVSVTQMRGRGGRIWAATVQSIG